jgi:hypothetical protein
VLLVPSTARAAQLLDGTRIRVRVTAPVVSDNARAGDPVTFVVAENIIADGTVLIRKGTPALGVVARARRASWGFLGPRHARLEFSFTRTTATNGEPIRLRASAVRLEPDRVIVDDRAVHRHELLWASEADTYEAYVDGDYNF